MPALRPTHLALALLAPALLQNRAAADATVNFNSSIEVANVRSDGAPMDGSFAFQIGTFTGGFAPSADNTAAWLTHWAPLSDAAADPLSGATAPYSSYQLPFGTSTSGFSGSTELDHNQPPFTPMGAVYIWGYDNRTAAGPGEWILVTSSTWGWPVGTANPPATTFSVAHADTVLLGAVDMDGVHMRTAAVTVTEPAEPVGYDAWLAANFSAGALADSAQADTVWGALADPDADGLSNVVEYFTATDPTDPASKAATVASTDGDDLVFSFQHAKDTSGVLAHVEWSTDMVHWQTEGVEIGTAEDLGDVYRTEARIPAGAAGTFARLNVRRAFE